MWKCPKCGRSFKNENQHHFCGKAPETIDEYINAQDNSIRDQLQNVREAIRDELSNATEKISWSMPTYWKATTSSTLRLPRNTSVFIRDRQRWSSSLRGWRRLGVNTARAPFRSRILMSFPSTLSLPLPPGAGTRGTMREVINDAQTICV